MKRIFAAICILSLVAGCRNAETPGRDEGGSSSPPRPSADLVECALAGAADFRRVCTIEEIRKEDGVRLVLRGPDGGFHRLLRTDDGRGVVSADGAEQAEVSMLPPGRIEVRMGRDRYRLPVVMKPVAEPAKAVE